MATKVKPIGGANNGSERVVPVQRKPRFYPTEDRPKPRVSRKKLRPCKLRKSITPGTVLVLLAGKHKGKRVIFLKQLESGLLLITGPYKVNGVPLRRVPQSYVIATQTKIDISKVSVPERVADDFFKREKKQRKRTEEMFDQEEQGYKVKDELKEDQKVVDESILSEMSATPHLKSYMKSLFSLRNGQYPHQMVF